MPRLVREVDGSSPVTASLSVAILLAFLLLATQTMVHLTARSTVTAVAFDAAHRASAAGVGCGFDLDLQVRERLGAWSQDPGVAVTCEQHDGWTSVRIAGPSPARGLRLFGAGAPAHTLDPTVTMPHEGVL